jgi:hypothetical protein
LLILGALNIFMGSRSAGGVQILGGLTAFGYHLASGRQARKAARGSMRRVAFLIGGGVVCGVGLLFAYDRAARSGLLGETARSKYELESKSRLGVIFGSRTQFVAGVFAVSDSPWLGHGSWALDKEGYMADAYRVLGMEDGEYADYWWWLRNGGVIQRLPSHSHILQAWGEHGFLGGIFWIWILVLVVKVGTVSAWRFPQQRAVIALMAWGLIWNILFSPIGGRAALGAYLAFLCVIRGKLGNLPRNGQQSVLSQSSRARAVSAPTTVPNRESQVRQPIE